MYKKDDIVEVKCTYIHPWAVYYVIAEENDDDNFDKKSEPIRGMCHISQFSDGYVKDIKKYAEVGKTYRLQILSYDPEKRHINLSYKSLYKEEPAKETTTHIEESGEGFKDLSKFTNLNINNDNTNLNESE